MSTSRFYTVLLVVLLAVTSGTYLVGSNISNGVLSSLAFSAITAGTNANALLVSGSLAPSGGVVTSNFWQNFSTCTATGASPLSCGATNGGAVTIAVGATAVVINDSFVTSVNQIIIQFESSATLATRLGIATCNPLIAPPEITARVNSTSFTIGTAVAPIGTPACYTFTIIN